MTTYHDEGERKVFEVEFDVLESEQNKAMKDIAEFRKERYDHILREQVFQALEESDHHPLYSIVVRYGTWLHSTELMRDDVRHRYYRAVSLQPVYAVDEREMREEEERRREMA